MVEIQSERERDYLQQIAELQNKLSQLLDEQQVMKMRNITVSFLISCAKFAYFILQAKKITNEILCGIHFEKLGCKNYVMCGWVTVCIQFSSSLLLQLEFFYVPQNNSWSGN